MQTSHLHPNVRPLMHFAMLRECNFLVPVVIAYGLRHGVTPGQFMMIQAGFMLVMLVAEPLLNPLADRFGHRQAMLVGALCWVLGHVVFLFGYGWPSFMAAEVLLGLSLSSSSAAGKALLYESFLSINREDAHYTASTSQTAWASYASAVGMLGGGAAYALWPELSALLSIVGAALMLPVIARLKDTRVHINITDKALTYRQMWAGAWKSLVSPQVRWLVVMPALVTGSTITLFWSLQSSLGQGGVSPFVISLLLAAHCILRGLFVRQCPRLVAHLSGRWCFALCIGALAISFPALALLPWWAAYVPFILGAGCAFALAATMGNELLNRHLPSAVRATALGGAAVIGRLVSIATLGGWGLLQPLLGIPHTLLAIGGASVLLSTISWFLLPKNV